MSSVVCLRENVPITSRLPKHISRKWRNNSTGRDTYASFKGLFIDTAAATTQPIGLPELRTVDCVAKPCKAHPESAREVREQQNDNRLAAMVRGLTMERGIKKRSVLGLRPVIPYARMTANAADNSQYLVHMSTSRRCTHQRTRHSSRPEGRCPHGKVYHRPRVLISTCRRHAGREARTFSLVVDTMDSARNKA